MPERTMTTGEVEKYLGGTHIANLATLKSDGSPHVAPAWYEYRGEELYIIAGDSSVKVRNITRDPRVMVSIAVCEEPYRYVLMEGQAEVTTRDVEATTISICVRYRGPDRGATMARELLEDGDTVVIVVRPSRLITWMDDVSDG